MYLTSRPSTFVRLGNLSHLGWCLLAVERWFSWGKLRASLFQDDVRDSIFSQTNSR
ncbi:hypothetical protein [Peristeroidobacter soli]|uniref:hypothetical protein n=1 Tax=Peristeroidobacter soli TaxID=2497877 RepID=UPI00158B011B|nr:hypothetical protein [Peristeroidobacter soli]